MGPRLGVEGRMSGLTSFNSDGVGLCRNLFGETIGDPPFEGFPKGIAGGLGELVTLIGSSAELCSRWPDRC